MKHKMRMHFPELKDFVYALAIGASMLGLLYAYPVEAQGPRGNSLTFWGDEKTEQIKYQWAVSKYGPPWVKWFCEEASEDQKRRAHNILTAGTGTIITVDCEGTNGE